MKKSSLFVLLVLPLVIGMASCTGGRGGRGGTSSSPTSQGGTSQAGTSEPDPSRVFEVPVVDVSSLQIDLPPMETWDATSPVKNDGEYDIIDIYEVSDMHAMIDYDTSKGYWGFAGMANFFKEKREENKGTVIISSGDMWQGGSESNLTRGRIVAEAMRYVGFESMELGNHEFDWGEEVIQHNSTYFTDEMPLLCGNLIYKDTRQRPSYLKPSTIIERGGYKIGVLGTIGAIEYSIAKSAFANFEITDSADFARSESQRLHEEEHCDIVVWTTHDDAEQLVIPDYVDVIFGGHTHKDIHKDENNPVLNHNVPKLETVNYGGSIAHAQLKINPSTKAVADATGELVKLTSGYAKQEDNIKNLFDQYQAATNVVKLYELNTVEGVFTAKKELANLSCKAMFDAFKSDDGLTLGAMQNGNGGVRKDISAGIVTYGDVYTSFPFDNEVAYFEISGSSLPDFFESSSFRSCNVYVDQDVLKTIDSAKRYRFITTDYVCTNILGYRESKFTRFASTVIRDTVAEYIFYHSGLNASDYSSSLPEYKAPSL